MSIRYNQLRLLSSLLCVFLWIDRCPASSFEQIDQHARGAPAHVTYDIKALTAYLVKPTSDDRQKVRSFYVWIAENIAYDVRAGTTSRFLRSDPNRYRDVSPNEVLKQRKAVCQGYAELLRAMCQLSNIPCRLIPGYSRGGHAGSSNFTRANHAWNAVNIDQQWHLLDVTWGSGGLTKQLEFVKEFDEGYFLTDPSIFIQDHMPLDPVWQLLDCTIRMQSFITGAEAVRHDVAHSEVSCDGREVVDYPARAIRLTEREACFGTARLSLQPSQPSGTTVCLHESGTLPDEQYPSSVAQP